MAGTDIQKHYSFPMAMLHMKMVIDKIRGLSPTDYVRRYAETRMVEKEVVGKDGVKRIIDVPETKWTYVQEFPQSSVLNTPFGQVGMGWSSGLSMSKWGLDKTTMLKDSDGRLINPRLVPKYKEKLIKNYAKQVEGKK